VASRWCSPRVPLLARLRGRRFGRDVGESWREAAGREVGSLACVPQVQHGSAEGFGEEAVGLLERLADLASGGVDHRPWPPLGTVGCVVGVDLLHGLPAQWVATVSLVAFGGLVLDPLDHVANALLDLLLRQVSPAR